VFHQRRYQLSRTGSRYNYLNLDVTWKRRRAWFTQSYGCATSSDGLYRQ